MNANTQKFHVAGPAGRLECALDLPEGEPLGIALLAHPHPLYGGTMDNKVVQMMVRAFTSLNYVSVRMNFRGVGGSQGTHADGLGETEDMAVVLEEMKKQYPGLPVALGGYSFGTYVQSLLQERLAAEGNPPERMVLVSATAGRWVTDTVPGNTLLIHGEKDDIIPLPDLFDWARPQDLPVVVVTGADHLFNRKVHHIREIIAEMW
ncbi:alpha/beta hydrolase [Oxalobacter sp. OttesenSCG-928-P03]|nr:alpha/beta hydrolase [Oxalobacter sp. OttesenSCG-928-P03]